MRTQGRWLLLALFLCGCAGTPTGGDDAGGGGPDVAMGGDLAPNSCAKCAGLTPVCNASGHCVGCAQSADCAKGSFCKIVSDTMASCVPGCAADADCANGQTCCGGRCTDTASDAANCGACGMACSGAHSTATCGGGKCMPGTCSPGWGDCNMNPADGCEANLHADTANCTGCGKACQIPNAYSGCADGCYVAACKFGFDDCDVNGMNGCETSVVADTKNCGLCGKVCTFANATPACLSGNCAIGQCNLGFGDCDNNSANGCEAVVATDANNCGRCGNVCQGGLVCKQGGCTCAQCNIPNASSNCVNNMCVFASCNPGYADCNNNVADGCEVSLQTDNNNCSKCGMPCPMGQTCSGGMCRMFTCNPVCANGGLCIANNNCQTPPHAPGQFGPMHTFAGLSSSWFISTGQGGCSVNNMQNAAIDAQYFCQHFYGPNCNIQNGFMQGQTSGPNQMHKNTGCTNSGNNIPNTVCDNPAAPGMPCKMWPTPTGYGGLGNLVCLCQ